VTVDPSHPLFTLDGQHVLSKDGTTLIIFIVGSTPFPETVQRLGEGCLAGSRLGSLSIEHTTVREIGQSALSDVRGLTSVSLPATVELLGRSSFASCQQLRSFTLPANSQLRRIESHAFAHCQALASFALPDSVEVLCPSCFTDCHFLAEFSVSANSQLREIGRNAFAHCQRLTAFFIPKLLQTLSATAFGESPCGEPTPIATLTVDPESAFFTLDNGHLLTRDLTGLVRCFTPAEIPATVEVIGECAFASHPGITEVTGGSAVREIRAGAFTGCSVTTFALPGAVEAVGEKCFAKCAQLTEFAIPPDSRLAGIPAEAFYDCSGLVSFVLPASVRHIANSAFCGCVALASFTVAADSRLLEIGPRAFSRCAALAHFTVPRSVRVIREGAFSGCTALASVSVEENSDLQQIRENAFSGCSSLASFEGPPGFTHIEAAGFPEGCDVRSFSRGEVAAWLAKSLFEPRAVLARREKAVFEWGDPGLLVKTGVQNLLEFDHPCIVPVVAVDPEGGRIAMPRVEGANLENAASATGTEKTEIVLAIAVGLSFLHACGIVHGRLTPQNVIVDNAAKRARLCDFGRPVFRRGYSAPEFCKEEGEYTTKADLFSLGVLIYEIVTGQRAFEPGLTDEEYGQIVNKRNRPELPETIPMFLARIIRQCWDADPLKRPTARRVFAELRASNYKVFPLVDPEGIEKFLRELE
jgi:hypothetical protein